MVEEGGQRGAGTVTRKSDGEVAIRMREGGEGVGRGMGEGSKAVIVRSEGRTGSLALGLIREGVPIAIMGQRRMTTALMA